MKYKFTVDRRTWLRGEGAEKSRLLREDQRKCCLGFAIEQLCGVQECQLRGRYNPGDMHEAPIKQQLVDLGLVELSDNRDPSITAKCSDIMRVNDDREIFEERREADLKYEFATLDIEIGFIN